jgi:DNA replication protein DnaC
MLIMDDSGLEQLQSAQRNDLIEIMDDRIGNSSTVIISQLPMTNGINPSATTR